MNKYMISNYQNNFLQILVYLCYYRVLLKHTNLNITEFLSKILLFIEDCGSSGLSQDLSDKNANYEIWNYSLGSTLQFALFKIKIRLLESDQKCLHHGSSTKPLFSLYKRDNTTKKKKKKIIMDPWTS